MHKRDVLLIDRMAGMPCYGSDHKALRLTLEQMGRLPREELGRYEEFLHLLQKDPSGGFASQLRDEILDGAMVVVADDAAQWFLSRIDPKDLGYSDIPNATPPFRKVWVESGLSLNVTTPTSGGEQKIGRTVGVFADSHEPTPETRIDPRERWRMRVQSVIEMATNEPNLVRYPEVTLNIDASGKIIGCPGSEHVTTHCWIGILLTAVSFMHCKNVQLVPGVVNAKLNKVRRKRGKPPLVRYHTLEIGAMRRVLETEGKSEESGLKHALHICRGHFKTYTPEKPLMGQHVGTYWWPQHARGNAAEGVVVKDYAVTHGQG